MNPDEQHLKLIRIFHFVLGGFYLLFALMPTMHITMGISLMSETSNSSRNGPPFDIGLMFVVVGVVAMVLLAAMGACQFFVARGLNHHKWWMFCVVISGINCIWVPIGSALGVFTIIVLMRQSVQYKFGRGEQPAVASPNPHPR